MARGFVFAKLSHMRALLQRHNRERQDLEISAAIDRLKASLDTLQRKVSHSSLLGVEGSGSAAYFRGYRRLLDTAWKFTDRNRRPPRDPVNVLLSLGYTLLTRVGSSAVETVGLDPYAGFLHEIAYNRPALALDLVEEFRPVVDGIVLWCLNSGQVTAEDFSPGPAERPVILEEAGQRRFLQAFETRMDQRFTHPGRGLQFPMRQCLVEQARQIAGRIQRGPAGYQGMGFR
jgi:CRISPR-associated protein Cas1